MIRVSADGGVVAHRATHRRWDGRRWRFPAAARARPQARRPPAVVRGPAGLSRGAPFSHRVTTTSCASVCSASLSTPRLWFPDPAGPALRRPWEPALGRPWAARRRADRNRYTALLPHEARSVPGRRSTRAGATHPARAGAADLPDRGGHA